MINESFVNVTDTIMPFGISNQIAQLRFKRSVTVANQSVHSLQTFSHEYG